MEPFPQLSRGDVVRRWELCTGELTVQVIWPPLAIHLMEKKRRSGHRQHHPESRLARHHLCVSLGGPLKRHRLDHGLDAAEDTEFERRVASRRRAGEGSFHAPAAE